MQLVKEKQKKELKGADYEKDWNKINRKGQENPMQEPIRSEKELLDMHTDTQTRTHFQEKGAKEIKLFVVEKGTGAGKEKRKKREADWNLKI